MTVVYAWRVYIKINLYHPQADYSKIAMVEEVEWQIYLYMVLKISLQKFM